MSAAPNIATLYDWESHVEDALQNYFANANFDGFVFDMVATPRTNLNAEEILVTPRLTVSVSTLGPLEVGSGIAEGLLPDGSRYYDGQKLQIMLTVATSRDNVSQPHGLYRGSVRAAMLEREPILNAVSLPFYQIEFMTQTGSAQAVDEGNDEIQTQLTYSADMHLPQDSYPN